MFKIGILIYYLISVIYSFYVLSRKKENGLIKVLLINFLPVMGYVLIIYLFKPIKETNSELAVEVEGDFTNLDKEDFSNIYHSINIENEINVVPIQDALLINDNKVKRKLLIHSLKENSIQNPRVLEKALQSDDSETSHYAATAIMEMKRKLMNAIQELASRLDQDSENTDLMRSYEEVIKKYLESGFLDEGTYKQYQSLHSSMLERILKSGQGQRQHYIDKINCDLSLKEFEKAAYQSERFIDHFPNDETAYIMAMKLQYTLRNSDQLQNILKRLKKLPVSLSAEGLQIIRFWS